MLIHGETTLIGNNTVTMSGLGARLVDLSANAGHLTNADNTIQGQGIVGGGQMQLTNQWAGLIDANVVGAILQVDTRNGVDLVNDGVMRATNGATLRIHAFEGIFENTNGQIVAGDNSFVDFVENNLLIVGGNLLAEGSGIFKTNDFTSVRLQDLNLAAPFQIDDNANLSLIGLIHNSEIHINGQTAASSNLVINSDATLDGNDVINMNGPGARIWTQSGAGNNGRLTNVNNLIRGQGRLGNNQLRLTNQTNGVIDADVNGETLIVHTVFGDTAFNQGIMQASNGGILQVNGFGGGTEFDNTGGTIQALDNSLVRLQGGLILNGGLLASIGTSQIQTPPFESTSLKNISIEGEWIHSGAFVLRGPVENHASIVLDASTATIQVANDLPVVVSGTGSVKLAHVDHRLLGQTGNQGFRMTGGVLTGVGQVQVHTQFSADATVAPGNSIGTMIFNANCTHQFVENASIEIELGATAGTPGIDWDFMDVNGTFDFDDDQLESGVRLKLKSLDAQGNPGALNGFDQTTDYSWLIANCSEIEGFSSSFVTVDAAEFENDYCGIFAVTQSGNQLFLNYFSQVTETNADSFNVFRGFVAGGDVTETFASDDQYLQCNPGITLNADEPPVWLVFEGTLPDEAPQWLNIKLESHANTVSIVQSIEMFNWVTDAYEHVDTRTTSFNVDSTVNIAIPLPTDFVQPGSNKVTARTGWRPGGPILVFPWTVSIDHVAWLIH